MSFIKKIFKHPIWNWKDEKASEVQLSVKEKERAEKKRRAVEEALEWAKLSAFSDGTAEVIIPEEE